MINVLGKKELMNLRMMALFILQKKMNKRIRKISKIMMKMINLD